MKPNQSLICALLALVLWPLPQAEAQTESEDISKIGRLKSDLHFPAKEADFTDNLGVISLSNYPLQVGEDVQCQIKLLQSDVDRTLFRGDEFKIDYSGRYPIETIVSSELTSNRTFNVKVRLRQSDPVFYISPIESRSMEGRWGKYATLDGKKAAQMTCHNQSTTATATDTEITLTGIPAVKHYYPRPHCKAVQEAHSVWVWRQYETVYYCFELSDVEKALPNRATDRTSHQELVQRILDALLD